ncbi:hypothetical protein KGF54_001692 [Candida jiufengensis]|uniref:uncharacterized protein n=1 Tax=Candida jiufengensis TaxID=497108 RepID=UPI002224D31A|nr:uncharacterized protein KGF54_001692 [Candida jiufengensis]KAI5955131.1 hypothetical protein KGF54_001692 [Candida jiufengensis]
MVLKNSKWDKKAKYKFMKKHGLSNKPPTDQSQIVTPKWSTKKQGTSDKNKIQLEDSDDEWDSDVDEALINHFYPQLNTDEELSLEHKIKIKQQILRDLENEDQSGDEEIDDDEENEEEEELDGIYLGEKKEAVKEKAPKFNLEEFINNIDRKPKNKKLLKNKMSDNFLEEYGLESYDQLSRKKDDYNDIYNEKIKKKQNEKMFSKLNEFQEFELGKEKPKESNIRTLTEDEKQEDLKRAKLIEENKFYQEIKRKFEDKKPQRNKILDINNFRGDESQLSYLNEKIAREEGKDTFEDDIDQLLGRDTDQKEININDDDDDVTEMLNNLNMKSKPKQQNQLKQNQPQQKPNLTNNNDIDFLDSLI